MRVLNTKLNDVLVIKPKLHGDNRGFFMESWNKREFDQAIGKEVSFFQDNHSRSTLGVLRGLHYQVTRPQGKLVRVVKGAVLDVIVDIRQSSSTFGQHVKVKLTEDNAEQVWIPEGFAHGFVVLSESADLCYKTTDYYDPLDEHTIRWDDPELNIDWHLNSLVPNISDKDKKGCSFKDAKKFL